MVLPARVVAVLGLVLAACSRTPPEPTPTSTVSTSTAAPAVVSSVSVSAVADTPPKATAQSGRCLAPMASAAPPIPAPASPPACPRDPEPDVKMPEAQVGFPDTPGLKVDVEIAKNDHDIQRGLMYRQSMPEMRGMLFKLDGRRDHTFWMHNTCIPLDMMFADEDGTIVGIVESAKPLDDSSRSVGCPSSYVLEVNAGWSRRHGIRPGQKLGLPAAAR